MANTGNRDSVELNEESASTRQGTRFKSPITQEFQELEGGEITLVELTCYGSAPEEHWTELAKDSQDEDFVMEEESFSEVRLMDLHLSEKIAEGGQANVFFAYCERFSTPLVVKRLKYGQVDLLTLRRRMDKVMRLVRERSSAICKVMAVGKDSLGKVWILMERMGGDLRNLIDHGVRYVGYVGNGQMHYVKDGQMPFDYIDTIKMMMDIARGMEDLHSCGLIHRDLKAANILVTLLSLNPRHGEVIGLEQDLESLYFYVKVGDYESSDGIAGTGFWRPPEVLQALKDGTKPVWSCEGDVYSFAMLCYELLTGRIPFGEHRLSDYDVVLSGQRPELPAHVNSRMRNLLHCCWQTEPQKRPGWTAIIESLKDEFQLHQPSVRNLRLYRRLKPIPEVERPSMESSTDIEDQYVGLSSTELLASSSMKFRPEIEDQSAGSSSTGLREMEGLGQGHIKCHGHKWGVSGLGRFIPGRGPPKLVAPRQVETLHQASAQRASNLLNELFGIRGDPEKVITSLEKLIAVLQKRVVGKLAAIWKEGGAKRVITFSKEPVMKTRATKVAVFWEVSANSGITIDTLLKELSKVPKKRKAMEAAIFSQTKKLRKAFQAAVEQDIALESSSPVGLATVKAWRAYNNPWRGTRPTPVQFTLDFWRSENPVAFASWQEARRGESARKAASKAWQVAKETLKQVEKILVEKLVFELKLDFLAGMLKHDSKGDMDNNWWDSEANMDDYCSKFQTEHSCQCPLWMQVIGAWREGRNILPIPPESFGEMVKIIEEATHTSPSLEIVLGGWKSVGQDKGLVKPGILQPLILRAFMPDIIFPCKLFLLFLFINVCIVSFEVLFLVLWKKVFGRMRV